MSTTKEFKVTSGNVEDLHAIIREVGDHRTHKQVQTFVCNSVKEVTDWLHSNVDGYTAYIDNYQQQQKAEERNREYVKAAEEVDLGRIFEKDDCIVESIEVTKYWIKSISEVRGTSAYGSNSTAFYVKWLVSNGTESRWLDDSYFADAANCDVRTLVTPLNLDDLKEENTMNECAEYKYYCDQNEGKCKYVLGKSESACMHCDQEAAWFYVARAKRDDDAKEASTYPTDTVEAEDYYREMYERCTKATLRDELAAVNITYSERLFKKTLRAELLNRLVLIKVTESWSDELKKEVLDDKGYEMVSGASAASATVPADVIVQDEEPLTVEVIDAGASEASIKSTVPAAPKKSDLLRIEWMAYWEAKARGEDVVAPNKRDKIVVSSVNHGGAYTQEQMEAMKKEAVAATHVSCGHVCKACGGQVSVANVNFLKQAAIQKRVEEVAPELARKHLCWSCQQRVFDGKAPLTPEDRKNHVKVTKAAWNASRA